MVTTSTAIRGTALAAATGIVIALPIGATSAASGPNAVATAHVNMRAGPSTDYPVVTAIPDGRSVTVHGCTESFAWCDTAWQGRRGWVFARHLTRILGSRRLPVAEHGAATGLPVVDFAFEDYWAAHYRDYSWYRQRARWRPEGADPKGVDPGGVESARISFSPASGPPGTPIRVSLREFPPRTRVAIAIGSGDEALTVFARGRTDAEGHLQLTVRIPVYAPPGDALTIGAKAHDAEVFDRAGKFEVIRASNGAVSAEPDLDRH